MLENESLVTEATENTEQTAEETQAAEAQPEKTYTQTELDEIVGKRLARNSAKLRKEYDKKYGELENVLKAGTGKENIREIADTFRDFYQKKGIEIPKPTEYSARDIEILAKAEAEDIIRGGFDEVVEEADRLNDLGAENMTAREKAVFTALTEHIKKTETSRELSEIGVTEDVYNSDEFKSFASKFNPDTPIADIYNIYAKTQPRKEIKTMGSMKNTIADDSAVKDYYSYEEASRFTKTDFDKNPALYNAVVASMAKWK